jgi:hypothetical protein
VELWITRISHFNTSLFTLCWSVNSLSILSSGKRYDEKVDIFSFGIVLCEVRMPFLKSCFLYWQY